MSVFRDQLHVAETEGERFDLFLDLLASGEVVVFGKSPSPSVTARSKLMSPPLSIQAE